MTARGVHRLAEAWAKAQDAYDRGDISQHQWKIIYAVQRLSERRHYRELWKLIVDVFSSDPSPAVTEILAAGPLEDLIWEDGAEVLPEIEALAARNATFVDLLSGVWLPRATDPVTRRYEALGCTLVDGPAPPNNRMERAREP